MPRYRDKQSASLLEQINSVKKQITEEEEKARQIMDKIRQKQASHQQEKLLKQITQKVEEIYVASGFDADPSMGTLSMLTNIESKLEYLLGVMAVLDPAFVAATEKQREKNRRDGVREIKKAKQRKQQDLRIKDHLKKSQAPVMRKTGKPLMERSVPIEKKKQTQATGSAKESGNTKNDTNEDFMADPFFV